MDEHSGMHGMSMSSPEQVSPSGQAATDGNTLARSNSKGSPSSVGNASFPPPKTDKPRPHVCTTCNRSFARLEHLKRHERSHTKEKPFECQECTRCFARRDLLLRHQQKLHSQTTPSSRPRSGRRESAAGVATGRVRKNSVASNAGMRPRANTLSHVDTGTLGMLANTNPGQGLNRNYGAGHSHHNSFSGLSGGPGYQYRGVSTGQHSSMLGLPRIDTGLSVDLSGGLRTAPPFGGFGAEMAMNAYAFNAANANTINPSALHLNGLHSMSLDGTASPYHHFFGAVHPSMNEEDGSFDWMAHGFENQMTFAQAHENAIDDSSPSAMSTSNSPAGVSELMLDGSAAVMQTAHSSTTPSWHNNMVSQNHMTNSPGQMDFSSTTFNDIMHAHTGPMSPKSVIAQHSGLGLDMTFPTPPDMSTMESASMVPDFGGPPFHLPFSRHGGASTASTSSMDSSLRQSSITTNPSPELVNDHIRNILVAGLTQNSGFGQRKFSQPSISSPLSPTSASRTKGFNMNNFPSLPELQRYVSAYIQYFHPHLPFLHIPSLNFESLEYTTPLRTMPSHVGYGPLATVGGGSCLVLAMAAIGALYEHELNHSRDLFEYAKRFISCFLEERRKANMSKTQFGPGQHSEVEDTPLWLVQAMLLNVIYGHNCGDKTAAEVASNHCAALVSLARGAELARPPLSGNSNFPYTNDMGNSMVNANMQMNAMVTNNWTSMPIEQDDSDWRAWKIVEERKRTLYAVFILSSMLVSAYNHAPALTNSEIRLELPCDEELWSAENAGAWRAMGGSVMAESKTVAFSAALGHLLTAAQREQKKRTSTSHADNSINEGSVRELKPSTFGCLVLINALHNYIWETRQRHLGRQWTAQETEQMHAHIEPALRAWQAAWASNPSHSLERPNPFGAGPLSADSIPLLDLAYVRLFVNLGRSKEAFWQRDYHLMAEELAKGAEVTFPATEAKQHIKTEMPPPARRASQSPQQPQDDLAAISQPQNVGAAEPSPSLGESESGDPTMSAVPTTRRERYLRKAASYAADSLATADELGLTFADQTCRELPSQSAMCAFDCAQVLAEWVTTLQERVGKYIGVIGQDEMDLQQVPGVLLLEDVDRQLLEKIDMVVQNAWQKMGNETVPQASEGGYGSKILVLTAHMLDRAAVWPVTRLMARSLETQAVHMRDRALASVGRRV